MGLMGHTLLLTLVIAVKYTIAQVDFCYNSSLEGFRLNTTIYSTALVYDWVDCAGECIKEPCCRSINFKKEFVSESSGNYNCEMLHNVVTNTSRNLLERNSSYDYIFIINPRKDYNSSCLISKDLNESSEETTNACHLNASFSNTSGSFKCKCNSGFSGNGTICADIDECAEGYTSFCHLNASCSNTLGSYKCTCNSGFTGNGTFCTDVDECAVGSGNSCHLNASCYNTHGSYECKCNSGFTGNGTMCSDIDECAGPNSFFCGPWTSCSNTPGSYECICNSGLISDGTICKVHKIESSILSSDSNRIEFVKKLGEWLPIAKTGNWIICWRATSDGWSGSAFHSKCDGFKPTLTIVKVVKNNKNLIFGGYATESWTGYGYKKAPGSFLFSFRNPDQLPPFKAPLKNENSPKALYPNTVWGPVFGIEEDLGIVHYSYSRIGHTYRAPDNYQKYLLAGEYNFVPSEVEVLYLT